MIGCRKRRAFTLIELVIVIVIIGVLAGIAALSYSNITQSSKDAVAKHNLRAMKSAVMLYQADHNGALPESVNPDASDYPNRRLPGSNDNVATLAGIKHIMKYLDYDSYTKPGKGYTYFMQSASTTGTNPTVVFLMVFGGGLPGMSNAVEGETLYEIK